MNDWSNFFPRAWGTNSWTFSSQSWKQDQIMSEIKVFFWLPSLPQNPPLAEQGTFQALFRAPVLAAFLAATSWGSQPVNVS